MLYKQSNFIIAKVVKKNNRNLEKNSNSRGIIFRYIKENILKCIILKYVVLKEALLHLGCISPPLRAPYPAEHDKFIDRLPVFYQL